LLRLELRIVFHRGEEAHRAVGIVAGARGDADADGVGLEFLRAREACQGEFRLGERQRAGFRSVTTSVTTRLTRSAWRPAVRDFGVSRDHVPHLVREHRGKLGFIVGERDQPARHIELAARSANALTDCELSMVTL